MEFIQVVNTRFEFRGFKPNVPHIQLGFASLDMSGYGLNPLRSRLVAY